jgi:hypothetical protein
VSLFRRDARAATHVAVITFFTKEVLMTYRNDHDAALHRVAALESELAKLQSERVRVKEKPPAPSRDKRKLIVMLVGAIAFLCAAGVVLQTTDMEQTKIVVDPDRAAAPMDDITCAHQIQEWAARDARAADPRGAEPVPVIALMKGPVACGAASESIPSNESSLISVYYENDPVTLDGYATAEQLWREYHRARTKRWH